MNPKSNYNRGVVNIGTIATTSTSRGRVFVVQEPTSVGTRDDGRRKHINLTPALEYGSIEFLLEQGRRVYNGRQVVADMRRKLCGYTDADYIISLGDPAAIGIAQAIAAHVNKGRYTLLVWNGQDARYIPVLVDLNAE